MDLLKKLEEADIAEKQKRDFKQFYTAYIKILKESSEDISACDATLDFFLERLKEQAKTPYDFQLYHKKVREPLDFYLFGLNFMRPLVDLPNSSLQGKASLQEITMYLY